MTRVEDKNTHLCPPIWSVNISPYCFAASCAHFPNCPGGSWCMLPMIGSGLGPGGYRYFLAFKELMTSEDQL